MRNNDFERAFGDAPDSFELAMRRALLQDRKINAPRRIGRRALLIAALVALLVFSAAFAATRGFGLIDMMRERFQTSDAVETMLQSDVPQQGAGLSKFDAAIEQVICDGSKVYFTLRIAPKPGEQILIMESEMESFPDSQVPGSSETYEEVATRTGKRLYHAYYYTSWTGEYRTIDGNFISRQIDGDSLVYACSADCIPDEDGKLTLSVEVSAYDPANHTGREDIETAVITADVAYTSDMQSFRWKNPAKIKKLGIQITDLRVTDTPMSRSVQLSYKPLPGLSEAEKANASGRSLWFFDEAGSPIESALGGTMYKEGDTYHQWDVLPADSTSAIRIGGLEWLDYDNYETIGVTTIHTKDAKPVDIAKDIDKKRAAAKKEAEQREKAEAEWEAKVSATPEPRPASLPEVAATGCEIPLLRNYPTEYSGLVDQLEAIAAPVNLSVTGKKATMTIDQIVPGDQAMLVFYTIKSQQKIQRNDDPSIDPWFAKSETNPYFTATFDGEIPEATERKLDSFMTYEQFFLDDHTVTGWALLEDVFYGTIAPEKAWITLSARRFGSGLRVDMQLDRAAAVDKVIAPDALMPMKDHPELGVRVKRISLSPVINTLIIEEDRVNRGMHQEFLLRDDQGRTLTNVMWHSISGSDGTLERPVKEQRLMQFVGASDAKSITLVPTYEQWGEDGNPTGNVDFVPLDAPMPYTIEHGGVKTTIYGIALDANGMEIRYQSELPHRSVDFILTSTDETTAKSEAPSGREMNVRSSNIERDTGIQFTRWCWAPQEGAKKGEQVPASTIENLKYLRVETWDYATDEANAITIPLN